MRLTKTGAARDFTKMLAPESFGNSPVSPSHMKFLGYAEVVLDSGDLTPEDAAQEIFLRLEGDNFNGSAGSSA